MGNWGTKFEEWNGNVENQRGYMGNLGGNVENAQDQRGDAGD